FGGAYQLVSLNDIRRHSGRVFVPDSDPLVERIRAAKPNPRLLLGVISHPNVARPVLDVLLGAGARSLRETAAAPVSVAGDGESADPLDLVRALDELRSRR